MNSVIGRNVRMNGRAYQSKPFGQLGAVAPAATRMASCTLTQSFLGRNDHVIGWPTGTGGDPSG